ncbi:hypothetical protein QBC46DRAFT_3790 [Diplogelasinospora grovesii]|uniref:Myb-like DNA-binding domain-containing protein n=1 Tax=Diplogelasinospora grovesii TaxID=303347 RepID=A0AAN6NI79_9PEZI|nr:hypothetical protein QBC46DRAFT_3790 [Diplogelasinospora grovesii]
MSSANDNAMSRFLFAILKQKCLKDIDWNKVAHDPVLVQEISNGHAARMRYSRFRASMLGLEPKRRNSTSPEKKARVTKKRKEDMAKKKAEADGDDASTKAGTVANSSPVTPFADDDLQHNPSESQFVATATSTATISGISGICMPPQPRMHNARYLTPCSDSDVMAAGAAAQASFAPSPASAHSDMLHPDVGFATGPASHHGSRGLAGFCQHASQAYSSQGQGYTPFGYELDAYPAPFAEHEHYQPEQRAAEELGVHAAMLEHEEGSEVGHDHHVMVKHEQWDTQGYDV